MIFFVRARWYNKQTVDESKMQNVRFICAFLIFKMNSPKNQMIVGGGACVHAFSRDIGWEREHGDTIPIIIIYNCDADTYDGYISHFRLPCILHRKWKINGLLVSLSVLGARVCAVVYVYCMRGNVCKCAGLVDADLFSSVWKLCILTLCHCTAAVRLANGERKILVHIKSCRDPSCLWTVLCDSEKKKMMIMYLSFRHENYKRKKNNADKLMAQRWDRFPPFWLRSIGRANEMIDC